MPKNFRDILTIIKIISQTHTHTHTKRDTKLNENIKVGLPFPPILLSKANHDSFFRHRGTEEEKLTESFESLKQL